RRRVLDWFLPVALGLLSTAVVVVGVFLALTSRFRDRLGAPPPRPPPPGGGGERGVPGRGPGRLDHRRGRRRAGARVRGASGGGVSRPRPTGEPAELRRERRRDRRPAEEAR